MNLFFAVDFIEGRRALSEGLRFRDQITDCRPRRPSLKGQCDSAHSLILPQVIKDLLREM